MENRGVQFTSSTHANASEDVRSFLAELRAARRQTAVGFVRLVLSGVASFLITGTIAWGLFAAALSLLAEASNLSGLILVHGMLWLITVEIYVVGVYAFWATAHLLGGRHACPKPSHVFGALFTRAI